MDFHEWAEAIIMPDIQRHPDFNRRFGRRTEKCKTEK
jgi:hypothetical protein